MLFTSFYLNNHSKPQTCKDKVFRFEVTLNPLAFVYISSIISYKKQKHFNQFTISVSFCVILFYKIFLSPLPLRSVQSGHPPDVLHLCISDIRVRKGYREEEKSLKKWTSFILILIIALNLAGCSNRNVNRNLQNKPDITGTVLEVQDNSILLEINKEGYPDGTRCKVSLNEKNRDNYAEVSVGDEVVVYYDGKIAESDPLQINTVYGITLKNSVD